MCSRAHTVNRAACECVPDLRQGGRGDLERQFSFGGAGSASKQLDISNRISCCLNAYPEEVRRQHGAQLIGNKLSTDLYAQAILGFQKTDYANAPRPSRLMKGAFSSESARAACGSSAEIVVAIRLDFCFVRHQSHWSSSHCAKRVSSRLTRDVKRFVAD